MATLGHHRAPKKWSRQVYCNRYNSAVVEFLTVYQSTALYLRFGINQEEVSTNLCFC